MQENIQDEHREICRLRLFGAICMIFARIPKACIDRGKTTDKKAG